MNHRRVVSVTTAGILAALVVTVQCHKLPPGVLAQKEIRADRGGRVETPDGKLVLEIPANALTGNTTVTIAEVDSPPAYPAYGFMAPAGKCYDIDLGSAYLVDSITVTSALDAVPESAAVSLAYYDTTYGCWAFTGGASDSARVHVSGKTVHMSNWWTFYFRPPHISDKRLVVPYYYQQSHPWCAPTSLTMEMKYFGLHLEFYEMASLLALHPDSGVSSLEPLLRKAASVWSNITGSPPTRFYFVGDVQLLMRFVMGNLIEVDVPCVLWSERYLPGHCINVNGWSYNTVYFHDPSGAYGAGQVGAAMDWSTFFSAIKVVSNWIDAAPLMSAPENARVGTTELTRLTFEAPGGQTCFLTFSGKYPCGYYYEDRSNAFPDDPNADGLQLMNMPRTSDNMLLTCIVANPTASERSYDITAKIIDRNSVQPPEIIKTSTVSVVGYHFDPVALFDDGDPYPLGGLPPGRYCVRVYLESDGVMLDSLTGNFNLAEGTGGNNPPNTPSVPDGPSSGTTGTPYDFSSSATDPDGNNVAIRFDWGNGVMSDWSSYVSSGSPVTMSYAWGSAGTFYVKAQAKDLDGATSGWSASRSIVVYPEGPGPWLCATPHAQWSGRYYQTSVVFNNEIWVMGGSDNAVTFFNDVWKSPDGAAWTRSTADAEWSDRMGHASVVFDGRIWVLGGYDPTSGYLNDVWFSTNGSNWTCATPSAEWPARAWAGVGAMQGKLWVCGGEYAGSGYRNDVWCSDDGVHWSCVIGAAPWSERSPDARSGLRT